MGAVCDTVLCLLCDGDRGGFGCHCSGETHGDPSLRQSVLLPVPASLLYKLSTPSVPILQTRRSCVRGRCKALGQKDLGSSPDSIFHWLHALGQVTWEKVTEMTWSVVGWASFIEKIFPCDSLAHPGLRMNYSSAGFPCFWNAEYCQIDKVM